MDNPYLDLTRELNRGRLRALISSGQAVVVHRLAIMSKDGDWILREDSEATDHVLETLSRRGSRYRFGAPLDVRWLAGGWSAHFEHRAGGLRLRTDFVTRPPRLLPEALAATLPRRPLLARIPDGRDALDEALDRERRTLIRANEERLARFRAAAEAWAALWPEVAREIADLDLPQAHRIVTSRALGVLPFAPSSEEES